MGPASVPPLLDVIRRADLIVLGQTKVSILDGALTGTVTVERVFKGAATVGSSVPISWPEYHSVMPAAGNAIWGRNRLHKTSGRFKIVLTTRQQSRSIEKQAEAIRNLELIANDDKTKEALHWWASVALSRIHQDIVYSQH